MGTSDSPSFSSPDLRCSEEDDFIFGDKEDPFVDLVSCTIYESEGPYFQTLIEKESVVVVVDPNHFVSRDTVTSNWAKSARLGVIKWILSTRSFFGFHFGTAYLSLIYFDHFLSTRSIEEGKTWAVELLSVACLSLAAKMEEMKTPGLSQFQMNNCKFEWTAIQRMELLVLTTLQWKMHRITPFSYLQYFITMLYVGSRDSRLKELVSVATELILAFTREINLVEVPPSAVSMAAVLAASDDQLTRTSMEMKMSVISPWNPIMQEHIYSCYDTMQNIKKGKCKTPESVIVSSQSNKYPNGDCKRSLPFINSNEEHFPSQRIRRS
ncbi:cyclin-D5-1-like [Impatiens glandulifera]|uniref:cyclin-D5-1-like n=1 Tax=Impatiens glandulifera TaxID=253017 RepID=UPI001FB0AD4D|nr:cyclin-D5-1-like [Impatiens glandulifera]